LEVFIVATAEFGLMMRPGDPGMTIQELLAYNRSCIDELKAGFTTIWLEDHLQFGDTEWLECLTTLSYIAAQYPQFKVGSLVLAQSYRNPALLAKMAANIQTLSGGRLILGLGAGWKEDEYRAYNYPFPAVGTRMNQLEEAIQVLRAMWTTQPATFVGKQYQIHDAYSSPRPVSGVPLLIGGGGEQRTLGIVARYADWWNFNSVPVEEYARKVDILKQHCERVGRNPAEIKLSYLGTLSVSEDPARVKRDPKKHLIAGNAEEVTQELKRFQEVGVSHFMFRIPELDSLKHFVAHVVPKFL
jgi:alkanesulfonate monooxygenase SsuD/methylene tetrahydromethanopterin reductase-like flavin-dependent oxidoreductase (luciferase family)